MKWTTAAIALIAVGAVAYTCAKKCGYCKHFRYCVDDDCLDLQTEDTPEEESCKDEEA